MAQAGVKSNLDRLADRLDKSFDARVAQALLKAGEIVAGQIRREIAAWTSTTETRKTGALARSFTPRIIKHGGGNVEFGVYSKSKYARIHDEGGVIRPVTARALTVPLNAAAQRRSARGFKDLFRVGNVLMRKVGKQGRIEPMYALVKRVLIRRKDYIKKAAAKSLPIAQETVRAALQEVISSSGEPQ